jgi:hypothetical protein
LRLPEESLGAIRSERAVRGKVPGHQSCPDWNYTIAPRQDTAECHQ